MKRLFSATLLLSLICASALFGQIPTTVTRVVDAASFSTSLAPGSLAIVNGTNFGSDISIPVTVAGKACAVLSASATQLQIQIAVDAPLGATSLQVRNSAPFNISLSQYAPVMFSADGTGQGNVQAFHGNGTAVTTSSPAIAGEVIVISAIGLGPTVPPLPTGTPSPSAPPSFVTSAVQLTVAGQAQAALLFAGLVPGKVGVYQINFVMPFNLTTGAQPIFITIGGKAVSNTLTLPASDAPVVSGMQNNYSFIAAGLPNYGIAQGSIFVIYGANFAKSSSPLQNSYPLHTSLGGVSISVTVNGVTTHTIPYYVTPNQLAAILPSSTPVGTGQITVTSNGQTGLPAPIQVVQSAIGLLTLNQAGSGPAAASDAKFNYLGFTNAVHVGESVNFWGSGVGPAAGDETNLQTPVDLVNIPIEVDIGGISAKVTYHGRSVYPGLDQIQAIVPDGVQPGCSVSVVVRTGNIVSNFVTIPVAVGSRTCSEPAFGITADQLQGVFSKPSFLFSSISLNKDVSIFPPSNAPGAPNSTVSDRATAQFARIQQAQFPGFQNPSVGSCVVYYNGFNFGVFNTGPLDAGLAINLSGPSGKVRLDPSGDEDGRYYEFPGDAGTFPIFIPDAGGTFSINNGAGGPDVGAFTTSLALGAPLVWSNAAAITTVDRSKGVTVTWTGGAPNSYVQISGTAVGPSGAADSGLASVFGVGPGVNAFFSCAAPVAAGQFTIPAAVLLALPPTPADVHPFPTLSVGNVTGGAFTGPALDLGIVTATVNSIITVTYK